MRTGQATWDEALLLFLERSGYPEETYHTFSYSPLPDDGGKIEEGMLCVVTEETDRVIGERRVSTLRDLGSQLAARFGRTRTSAKRSRTRWETTAADLPFSILYQVDAETGGLRRMSETGGVDQVLAPPAVERAADLPWPVRTSWPGGRRA